MELPKDNEKLDEIFLNGTEPDPDEFKGDYWVDMLTGGIPSFRWAGHKKRFFEKIGNNFVLRMVPFGHFIVAKGECDDLDNLKVVILDYGNGKNILTRSIRDKIRKINDTLYLGRYYAAIGDTHKFKGYFSLEKKA